MQSLYCRCGQPVFCDNTLCGACGRALGFDPFSNTMLSLEPDADGALRAEDGERYALCSNRDQYEVCNGLVALAENGEDAGNRCHSCVLNRTIPSLRRKRNILLWSRLERAKRRMISGLSALGLDLHAPTSGGPAMMCFDFLEDKRSHPDVMESFVSTGHKDGVITVNVLEADDVQRVRQRQLMGERYRTVLGHFRHEAGHFFYLRLVRDNQAFADLFGDPLDDYDAAMNRYYEAGPPENWETQWISAYACSHPLEDWAECFAHYLHMQDTLETAAQRGLGPDLTGQAFAQQMQGWIELSMSMNEISRSLGVRDAYPFVLTEKVAQKLGFVARCIEIDGSSS